MARVSWVGGLFACLLACGHPLDPFKKDTSDAALSPLVFAGMDAVTKGEVLNGSYIVAFRTGMSRSNMINKNYKREYQSHYLRLAHLEQFETGVKNLHYITAFDLSETKSPKKTSPLTGPAAMELYWEGKREAQPASIVRVDFDDELTAQKLLVQWMTKGLIYYAEPNYSSKPFEGETNFGDYATTYGNLTDVSWFDQIGLIPALESLNEKGATFENPPMVAVMDSGIDYEHPSLVSNIWTNEAPGRAGCLDDIHGCDTTKSFKGSLGSGTVEPAGLGVAGTDCPSGEFAGVCRHGTHVAGLIASEPNSAGYGGICPICRIVAVKIVGSNKLGEGKATNIADSSIISGLTYLSRFTISNSNAIRVVNASFGKFQRSRTVEHLVRLLKSKGNGIILVAAAGNEDSMKRQYPAAFKDVMGVVNVESSVDAPIKAQSSNFGIWADISAPGSGDCLGFERGLLSTVPGGGSACESGTSMAAPVVAGIIGLLLISEPDLNIDQIRDRLLATADPDLYNFSENVVYYPGIKGEPNPIPLLGAGVVNANNVINLIKPTQRPQAAFERVTSTCGVLGSDQAQHSFIFSVILFGIPFMAPFLQFKRRRNLIKI